MNKLFLRVLIVLIILTVANAQSGSRSSGFGMDNIAGFFIVAFVLAVASPFLLAIYLVMLLLDWLFPNLFPAFIRDKLHDVEGKHHDQVKTQWNQYKTWHTCPLPEKLKKQLLSSKGLNVLCCYNQMWKWSYYSKLKLTAQENQRQQEDEKEASLLLQGTGEDGVGNYEYHGTIKETGEIAITKTYIRGVDQRSDFWTWFNSFDDNRGHTVFIKGQCYQDPKQDDNLEKEKQHETEYVFKGTFRVPINNSKGEYLIAT